MLILWRERLTKLYLETSFSLLKKTPYWVFLWGNWRMICKDQFSFKWTFIQASCISICSLCHFIIWFYLVYLYRFHSCYCGVSISFISSTVIIMCSWLPFLHLPHFFAISVWVERYLLYYPVPIPMQFSILEFQQLHAGQNLQPATGNWLTN